MRRSKKERWIDARGRLRHSQDRVMGMRGRRSRVCGEGVVNGRGYLPAMWPSALEGWSSPGCNSDEWGPFVLGHDNSNSLRKACAGSLCYQVGVDKRGLGHLRWPSEMK